MHWAIQIGRLPAGVVHKYDDIVLGRLCCNNPYERDTVQRTTYSLLVWPPFYRPSSRSRLHAGHATLPSRVSGAVSGYASILARRTTRSTTDSVSARARSGLTFRGWWARSPTLASPCTPECSSAASTTSTRSSRTRPPRGTASTRSLLWPALCLVSQSCATPRQR